VAASLTSPSPVLLLLRTEAANGEDWVQVEEVKFYSVAYHEGAEGE
jgi:hypothetical protein